MSFLAMMSVLGSACAHAQPAPAAPQAGVATEGKAPRLSEKERLDAQFARLKAAPSEARAKIIAQGILFTLTQSRNATVRNLLQRAQDAKDAAVAQNLLETLVDLYPQDGGLRYRRALLLMAEQDYAGAMPLFEAVLRQEPRHFQAWASLGQILEAVDQPAGALKAYRQAQALYPLMEGLAGRIDRLERRVEGQKL